MGAQTARLYYEGKDHKDIYFQGMYHDAMYLGDMLVWKKISHPNFAQYYMISPTYSDYGSYLVDEFGEYIIANNDAVITKAAAYIKWQYSSSFGTEVPYFTIACVGENITSIRFEGYFSYQGEIIYTHDNVSSINVFPMSKDSNGIWSYNSFKMIEYNFRDAEGNNIVIHSTGVSGDNMRLFTDLDEMKAWLLS